MDDRQFMKSYIYEEKDALERLDSSEEEVSNILEEIAAAHATHNLVATTYVSIRAKKWHGVIYNAQVLPKYIHINCPYKWKFCDSLPVPEDLPKEFNLMQLYFGATLEYPYSYLSIPYLEVTVNSFKDHLAKIFAHELYHFNHLKDDASEVNANLWALSKLRSLGHFNVEATRNVHDVKGDYELS